MKTLLEGKPYVPAAQTNLKATFARIRKQMKELKAETELKVQPIRKANKL